MLLLGLVDCLDTEPIVVVLSGIVVRMCFKCFVSVLVSMGSCLLPIPLRLHQSLYIIQLMYHPLRDYIMHKKLIP